MPQSTTIDLRRPPAFAYAPPIVPTPALAGLPAGVAAAVRRTGGSASHAVAPAADWRGMVRCWPGDRAVTCTGPYRLPRVRGVCRAGLGHGIARGAALGPGQIGRASGRGRV